MDVSDLLYIHESTVQRIITRYSQSGDVSPATYQHGPQRMLGTPEEYCIIESLMANPSMYLSELQLVHGQASAPFFEQSAAWDSLEKS